MVNIETDERREIEAAAVANGDLQHATTSPHTQSNAATPAESDVRSSQKTKTAATPPPIPTKVSRRAKGPLAAKTAAPPPIQTKADEVRLTAGTRPRKR